MRLLLILFFIIQFLVAASLMFPFLLYLFNFFRKKFKPVSGGESIPDYAIIVTAYQQTVLIPSVVDSILKSNYENYIVYVVADNCDISNLNFTDERIVVLRPEETLSSNTKSHFFAIRNFKRQHEYLTIIDSDNLVDPDYFNELNKYFFSGFIAVQGVRKAKNLNTSYACLDEAGDMYYRYIDRKLLFESGSSASLAGSGMAFTTIFYKECLELLNIEGAGFDKVLQMEILNRGNRIAFAETAIVYDEKTSKSDQLVNQRARWINTWFKYAGKGIVLAMKGVMSLNWNQFLCGVVFSRPPLFIVAGLTLLSVTIDIFVFQGLLLLWLVAILSFLFIFFKALIYFKATRVIYTALIRIPVFMFLQVLSLFKAKKANQISTATVHYYESKINDLGKKNIE